MTLPFHLPTLDSSESLPYGSTAWDCCATAEYTTANPTKWAVLTGNPAAINGVAKFWGSSFVIVAAGATPLIVMFSRGSVDRRDRISPSNWVVLDIA